MARVVCLDSSLFDHWRYKKKLEHGLDPAYRGSFNLGSLDPGTFWILSPTGLSGPLLSHRTSWPLKSHQPQPALIIPIIHLYIFIDGFQIGLEMWRIWWRIAERSLKGYFITNVERL